MRKRTFAFLVALGLIGGGGGTVAVTLPSAAAMPASHIVGTWPNDSSSGAGGWILWSNGRVRPVGGAGFFGDARSLGLNNFVGMLGSTDISGSGYWLVTSSGAVHGYGTPCGDGSSLQRTSASSPASGVVGVIARSDNYAGLELVTASGGMYGYECEFND
jgi:hypothetical protein